MAIEFSTDSGQDDNTTKKVKRRRGVVKKSTPIQSGVVSAGISLDLCLLEDRGTSRDHYVFSPSRQLRCFLAHRHCEPQSSWPG